LPDKVQFVLREAGNLFAISLEGLRRTWDVRSWWREYLGQCWFIAKITSLPVILISIPFGMVIALHVGTFNRHIGAESATGAAMVLAIVREAAPVATALLIAGAGGSAMTADLGARKIRDELSAIRARREPRGAIRSRQCVPRRGRLRPERRPRPRASGSGGRAASGRRVQRCAPHLRPRAPGRSPGAGLGPLDRPVPP